MKTILPILSGSQIFHGWAHALAFLELARANPEVLVRKRFTAVRPQPLAAARQSLPQIPRVALGSRWRPGTPRKQQFHVQSF